MQLVTSPNKWLSRKVSLFDFEALDAKAISWQMMAVMTQERGIGLSANQVALDAQIFVMKPYLLENNTPLTIINPEIISVDTVTEVMPEGCLSRPGLFLTVKRPKSLIAKYLDINGNSCTIELYDIDARCFLHEYDHLQGIEFVDRVSQVKLKLAKKKQQKLRKNHGRTK